MRSCLSVRRLASAILVLFMGVTGAPALTITVDSWGNFTAAQQSRTQDAIDEWEALLPSSGGNVHITFNYEDLGAKAFIPTNAEVTTADVVTKDGRVERTTLGVTDSWAVDGDDRPSGARIRMTSHGTITWYMGTGAVPDDEFDWYSVVTHEICHAVGFTVNYTRFARNVTDGPGSLRTYNAGGTPTATLVNAAYGTHFDAATHPGLLMVPSIGSGTRRSPSSLEEDVLEHDVWDYPDGDLRVSAASATVDGTTVNITATVRDDGPGAVDASWLGYYVSENTTITTGDHYLGTDYVAALASGATSDESLSVDVLTAVPSIPAGTYYIGLIADFTGLVAEGDETDNDRYISTPTVTVPATGTPTGLAASDGDAAYPGRVHVTWSPVSGATHYNLYRNTVNNSGTATSLAGWRAITSYEDYQAPGQVYWYWVKAAQDGSGLRASSFSAANSGYVDATTLSEDVAVVTGTAPAYYEFNNASAGFWAAVGVRHNAAAENWSLRLYNSDAFTNALESSAWDTEVDFVVVDGNHVSSAYRGVEAYRPTGTHDATVEYEGGANTLNVGTNGAYSWPAGDVVEVWDVTLAGGTYRVGLQYTAGSANLDIALFSSQDGDYYRSRGNYLGRSLNDGAVAEDFYVTVPASDDYGLCVWANDTNSASYKITIVQTTAGLWEGDVSSDWHTAGNWNDNAVPAANDDVTIPGGTPHSPLVSGGAAACSNLTIQAGATLTVSNRVLTVGRNVTVYGSVTIGNGSAADLVVHGGVYWQNGSTASMPGSGEMQVYGHWYFYEGAAVQLTSGYVDFMGNADSYIRTYEENCRFYRIEDHKTSPGELYFSSTCTAPLRTYYLYTFTGATFRHNASYDLLIGGSCYNSGGHFIGSGSGALVFDGNATTYDFTPGIGDYVHDLRICATTPVDLNGLYTNTLQVVGDLIVESGSLRGNGVNIAVGGNWSNAVGAAGYVGSTGAVSFVGTLGDQNVWGTNVFHSLSDARGASGSLVLHGQNTVSNTFTLTQSTAVHGVLDVLDTLNANAAGCALSVSDGASVWVQNLNMGGAITVHGGSFEAADVDDSYLAGQLAVGGGLVDLTQAASQRLDLGGSLNITGGRLNLHGGMYDLRWPYYANGSITMSGGILDVTDQGISVESNAYSFAENITGGTIRSARGFACERASFTPAGGTVELYGTATGAVNMVSGSTLHDILINKVAKVPPTVTATANLDLSGDFLLRHGVFNAPAAMAVGGAWSNGVGAASFVEGTGTVTFDGGGSSRLVTDEQFYNLQVDKTYASLNALEVLEGRRVTVGRNLTVTDGTMEMDQESVLDVAADVTIALGAGLNINDGNVSVFIGDDFVDYNPTRSTYVGLMPGGDCTVTFDGTGLQGLTTVAPYAEVVHLVIDKEAGEFSPGSDLVVDGSVSVLAGEWSSSHVTGLTHSVAGDFAVASAGTWSDETGTLTFNGPTNHQRFANASKGTVFGNLRVEKVPKTTVWLDGAISTGTGRGVTVAGGELDLNGNVLAAGGSVAVDGNAVLTVDAGARLRVGSGYGLTVRDDGYLSVNGTTVSPARVTRSGTGYYAFDVESGGMIAGEDAIFEYMDLDGLNVQAGATISTADPFDRCTFQYGQVNGALLTVNNTQTLTIKQAVFPTNAGGSSRNVRKDVNSGRLSFVAASGVFAGESYDFDGFDRVDWHTGAIGHVAVAGPPVATRGGTYTFGAGVTGDMTLTPITYRWTVSEHAPYQGSSSATNVARDYAWDGAGAKTVTVTASNAVGGASGSWPVDVRDLCLDACVFRCLGPASNRVDLTLSGTSSQSMYRVEFRTNLLQGAWQAALPDGGSIPGRDGSLGWTDHGGPSRDLNACQSLYYRAVLDE